jgi:hypothetical protein
MSPIPVNMAVEDELSDLVLRTLLRYADRNYFIGTVFGRGGYGYLRRTAPGWNAGARGTPFILLTDLDNHTCPPALIQEWLNLPIHPNLIFRVAVREVEAWLLADKVNIARFLCVAIERVPGDCEQILDPKRQLVELARRSRSRDIKERVAPKAGSTATQGPDYNGCLGRFVINHWDIEAASAASPSLARAVHRLVTFNPTWAE